MVKIIAHSCIDTQQDQMYGKQMRVMNHASGKGAYKDRYRCTSCGQLVSINLNTKLNIRK